MSRVIFFLLFPLVFMGCHSSKPNANSQKSDASTVQIHKAIRPVRINIGSEPQSLDPRKARELCSLAVMRMLFEGLTRTNLREEAELALAKEVSISKDMLTYTFKLR